MLTHNVETFPYVMRSTVLRRPPRLARRAIPGVWQHFLEMCIFLLVFRILIFEIIIQGVRGGHQKVGGYCIFEFHSFLAIGAAIFIWISLYLRILDFDIRGEFQEIFRIEHREQFH